MSPGEQSYWDQDFRELLSVTAFKLARPAAGFVSKLAHVPLQ